MQRRLSSSNVSQGADSQEVDQERLQGIGLLGLGDNDHAVQSKLFQHFAFQKDFVPGGAREWRDRHSDVQAFDAIDPQSKPDRQCGSFCVPSALAEHNISQESFDACKALLFLVNRGMKDLYAAFKKQIDSSAQHPLFFVRMLQPDGTSEFRGWLLTRAMFKPRQVDGIAVYPVEAGQTLSEDGSEDTLAVYMNFHSVEGGVNLHMPEFTCIDEMAFEIAVLKSLFPDGRFQYCFRPAYSLTWVLTHLQVSGFRWIDPGSLHLHDDDEGDEDDDDQQELDQLDELVAELTSLGVSGGAAQKKPRTRRARNNDSGRLVSSPMECVCFLFIPTLLIQSKKQHTRTFPMHC